MIICASLVSTSFTVGEAIAADLDPLVLTFVRFVLAVIVLAPYLYFRYGLRVSVSLFLRCSVISGCLVLFFWCMFLALKYTTALNTSVIFALAPSISGVYAMILVKEKLGKPRLIALACGVCGVVWVIFRGDFSLLAAMQWNRGDLIFLGGCFAMGLYTPLVRLLHRGESMLVITFWVLVTGAVWLLLFGAKILFVTDWAAIVPKTWLGVGYLAVFTTVITFFLTQYCTLFLGPTRVMAYSYLYPALVLILDLLAGKGLPPLAVMPGVVIVLLAMAVLQYSSE